MNDIDLAFILSDKNDIDGNIGNKSSVGVSDNVSASDIKSDNVGSDFNICMGERNIQLKRSSGSCGGGDRRE